MRLTLLLAALLFININISNAQCDPADYPGVICISEVRVSGSGLDDYVTLCNNSTETYVLEAVMIVDSNPNNEITLTVTIPPLSCVTLLAEDISDGGDLDFGFNGTSDSFTITCMDGSVFVTLTYDTDVNPTDVIDGLLNPETFGFCDPPVGCNGADFSNLTITGVNNDDDFVVVCNSSCEDIILSGASVYDDDGPAVGEVLINGIVPGGGCITLFRNEAFSFGLGGMDEFTIDCNGTTVSASWDTTEDQVSFVDACDPSVAESVYILEIVADDPAGGPDQVTLCNNSANLVSLDNAFVSDDIADATTGGDPLFGLTIAPYGCITLIRNIDFGFGIGNDEDFVIYCEDVIYDALSLDGNDVLQPDGVVAPVKPIIDSAIPTMGEWGLICLTFLLLIVGVVRLKEKEQQLSY